MPTIDKPIRQISEETRLKMRMGHLGKKYKPMSEEGKMNLSISHTGKKQSAESIEKRRISNAGFKHSQRSKDLLSILRRGEGNGMYGKVNNQCPNWKGDEVGYYALHSWVSRKLGKPCDCVKCGKMNLSGKNIHWANISHTYKRDFSDWVRLCTSCHKLYDLGKITL